MLPARILIADDYDDNRELMRLMLESAGHLVRETRDGRECVQAAQAELPDIALIDLSMPVLDGWGTLSELRADERTRSLCCIAVTAFAADQDRQRVLAAGSMPTSPNLIVQRPPRTDRALRAATVHRRKSHHS
jgi:CheY-like chemotaxis protein